MKTGTLMMLYGRIALAIGLMSALALAFIAPADGAQPYNPTHEKMAAMSETDRNARLSYALQDEGCRVTTSFFQGFSKEGHAFWNVACSNGNALSIMIRNDARGSMKILECSLATALGMTECFHKFPGPAATRPKDLQGAGPELQSASAGDTCVRMGMSYSQVVRLFERDPRWELLAGDVNREGISAELRDKAGRQTRYGLLFKFGYDPKLNDGILARITSSTGKAGKKCPAETDRQWKAFENAPPGARCAKRQYGSGWVTVCE